MGKGEDSCDPARREHEDGHRDDEAAAAQRGLPVRPPRGNRLGLEHCGAVYEAIVATIAVAASIT
jgi:hypothetical protein